MLIYHSASRQIAVDVLALFSEVDDTASAASVVTAAAL